MQEVKCLIRIHFGKNEILTQQSANAALEAGGRLAEAGEYVSYEPKDPASRKALLNAIDEKVRSDQEREPRCWPGPRDLDR
jgi:hypothetical protein